MSAFAMGCFVYAVFGIALGLWGVRTMEKRAGPLMADFLANREEIADGLRAGAISPWDPFNETGGKRWRGVLFVAFGILVLLNFSGL